MSTSKHAKLAKRSNDAALRDTQKLKRKEIFVRNTDGKRNTSYRLRDQGRSQHFNSSV